MTISIKNRRVHTRYELENSVSVSSDGICQITDISRGGFCFKCPPTTLIPDAWETDILTPSGFLDGLPANRVWTSESESNTSDYSPMIVGVKFGKLTPKKESILLRLLDNLDSSSSSPQ